MGIESGPKFNPEEQNFDQENQKNKDKDIESGPEIMIDLAARMIEEAEKIEIRPEDRNEKGDLLVSPDGPVSILGKQNELWWKIARTESFKEFFGDWQNDSKSSSKIVDRNGEPLVVFRGLSQPISSADFYNRKFYQERVTGDIRGVYISPSHQVVSELYGKGGWTFCLFINSRRPTERGGIRKGLEEMMDEIFYIPKKYLKISQFFPKMYDSVLGVNRNIQIADKSVPSESKKLEDLYEIVVRDPNQILIIPSSIDREHKDVREYSKDIEKDNEIE